MRVLLVDDHPVVRLGLRFVLESHLGCEVTEVGDADVAADLARSGTFDLLIIDVRLDGRDGLWVVDRVRDARPDVPILMISTYDDPHQVQAAIDRGVNGYLLKEASPSQLEEAVEVAMSGRGLYLHPSAAASMRTRVVPAAAGRLSPAEVEVLRMVAVGRTNGEIGIALFCSEKTVKARITSILRKLGVKNRTQAAAWALRAGLVESAAGSDGRGRSSIPAAEGHRESPTYGPRRGLHATAS